MEVFRGLDAVPTGFGPSAITIGKFDGVHTGHRAVIAGVIVDAHDHGLKTAVVTFDRNPLATLRPESCPAELRSLAQKLELLSGTGIDATLVLDFDEAMAAIPAAEFVQRILVDAVDARIVTVGRDFRFGSRGEGDVELLRVLGQRHGFDVRVIDDVMPARERRVSSTWIRELLTDGDIATATALLGYAPGVRGIVVHGAKRGRELGFPTANIQPHPEGLIPADGVYAGWLIDGDARYPAAISVGNNPTFEGVALKQVEAFVLDQDIDLYDHLVTVEFTARIRGMVAFTGIEPLIKQMTTDVEQVRAILRVPAAD